MKLQVAQHLQTNNVIYLLKKAESSETETKREKFKAEKQKKNCELKDATSLRGA